MRAPLDSQDTWPSMRMPPLHGKAPTVDQLRAEILRRRKDVFGERRQLLDEQDELVQALEDGEVPPIVLGDT